ncbi:hypothetical protein HQ584_06980 [Patescibacteria group bacterium]|nr:hypothetical protein [Patescibacteria group bacterium]
MEMSLRLAFSIDELKTEKFILTLDTVALLKLYATYSTGCGHVAQEAIQEKLSVLEKSDLLDLLKNQEIYVLENLQISGHARCLVFKSLIRRFNLSTEELWSLWFLHQKMKDGTLCSEIGGELAKKPDLGTDRLIEVYKQGHGYRGEESMWPVFEEWLKRTATDELISYYLKYPTEEDYWIRHKIAEEFTGRSDLNFVNFIALVSNEANSFVCNYMIKGFFNRLDCEIKQAFALYGFYSSDYINDIKDMLQKLTKMIYGLDSNELQILSDSVSDSDLEELINRELRRQEIQYQKEHPPCLSREKTILRQGFGASTEDLLFLYQEYSKSGVSRKKIMTHLVKKPFNEVGAEIYMDAWENVVGEPSFNELWVDMVEVMAENAFAFSVDDLITILKSETLYHYVNLSQVWWQKNFVIKYYMSANVAERLKKALGQKLPRVKTEIIIECIRSREPIELSSFTFSALTDELKGRNKDDFKAMDILMICGRWYSDQERAIFIEILEEKISEINTEQLVALFSQREESYYTQDIITKELEKREKLETIFSEDLVLV